MRLSISTLVAAIAIVGSSLPAMASSFVCGGPLGVNIELTSAPVATSCQSGVDLTLATGSDPSGLTVLDVNNGLPFHSGPLTLSFDNPILRTDGSFSFGPPAGYNNFAIGFQLYAGLNGQGFLDPENPDWFIFFLPAGLTSGQFDSDFVFISRGLHETFSDFIQYAVLYGQACPTGAGCESPSTTPLPAALPLFASGLGAMGFIGWRRRRKKVLAVA